MLLISQYFLKYCHPVFYGLYQSVAQYCQIFQCQLFTESFPILFLAYNHQSSSIFFVHVLQSFLLVHDNKEHI